MMPSAPAFETAEASCARAIQPIGACTIGISTPSSSVTRFAKGIGDPPRACDAIAAPGEENAWTCG